MQISKVQIMDIYASLVRQPLRVAAKTMLSLDGLKKALCRMKLSPHLMKVAYWSVCCGINAPKTGPRRISNGCRRFFSAFNE